MLPPRVFRCALCADEAREFVPPPTDGNEAPEAPAPRGWEWRTDGRWICDACARDQFEPETTTTV